MLLVGNTDTDGEGYDLTLVNKRGILYDFSDVVRSFFHFLFIQPRHTNRKFFAAEADEKICIRYLSSNQISEMNQHRIATVMPKCIVNVFELVDIQNE